MFSSYYQFNNIESRLKTNGTTTTTTKQLDLLKSDPTGVITTYFVPTDIKLLREKLVSAKATFILCKHLTLSE